jgi:drug/metabolite transporter (DMT)-like permease
MMVETYLHGHHDSVLRSHRWRTAENSAGYLLARLPAAAHVLGVGCVSALVVLAAAVLQDIFHTAQKPLLGRYTGFEVTAYAIWAGTLFVLPWTGSLLRALPQAGAAAVGSAVFLGVAPSALGFAAWAYAMARTDVGRVTTSLYLVPAAAIVSRWSGWARSPVRSSWPAARSPWPG